MTKLELFIDDGILKEAENMLFAVGIDIQIAVNIFLRRVIIERGLPMSMTASPLGVRDQPEPDFPKDDVIITRNNCTITKGMADEVWRSFMKYYKGSEAINRLCDEIVTTSGMNRGSAFIYLHILDNLVKGMPNTRTMKMKDLDYFMATIKSDLGIKEYQNAIKSLKISIPYWRKKLPGAFADKVETYCKMHEQDIIRQIKLSEIKN
jgi:hypothetical protein